LKWISKIRSSCRLGKAVVPEPVVGEQVTLQLLRKVKAKLFTNDEVIQRCETYRDPRRDGQDSLSFEKQKQMMPTVVRFKLGFDSETIILGLRFYDWNPSIIPANQLDRLPGAEEDVFGIMLTTREEYALFLENAPHGLGLRCCGNIALFLPKIKLFLHLEDVHNLQARRDFIDKAARTLGHSGHFRGHGLTLVLIGIRIPRGREISLKILRTRTFRLL
jgi:hypothetical protein